MISTEKYLEETIQIVNTVRDTFGNKHLYVYVNHNSKTSKIIYPVNMFHTNKPNQARRSTSLRYVGKAPPPR